MSVTIQFSQRYFYLDSWILSNIIQLATQDFCDKVLNYKTDPCRRLFDQMIMAARSGVANNAEGSSRHSTSIETELRLLDTARASLDELQGDYFNFLLRNRAEVWPKSNPDRETIWQMKLDPPQYSGSLLHDAAIHILNQKSKFDSWLKNDNPEIMANALLVLIGRVNRMLEAQMQKLLEDFRQVGGFSENMTQERIEAKRARAIQEQAPSCPLCGKPMLKRMQKRGHNQGREFWGCSDFPRCSGLLPL